MFNCLRPLFRGSPIILVPRSRRCPEPFCMRVGACLSRCGREGGTAEPSTFPLIHAPTYALHSSGPRFASRSN